MRSCVAASDPIKARGVEILQGLLPNALAFREMAHDAHVLAKGPAFVGLHAFFGEVYGALSEHVDEIKERARTLGGELRGLDATGATLPTVIPAGATGDALCEALFGAFVAYVVLLNTAFEAVDELRLNGLAKVLQDRLADLEKLGWQDVAHVS